MATVEYTCDACDAVFEIDTDQVPQGEVPMCPECGEVEIIRVTGAEGSCSCPVVPGTKRRN
jgi:hypothetical protein